MDGLSVKFQGDLLGDNFVVDKYGSFIPSPVNLHMDDVKKKIDRQLHADTGLGKRLIDIYWRTDVDFTNNPLGNTPAIAFGMKEDGARPLKAKKFADKMKILAGSDDVTKAKIAKRERRIEQYQSSAMALHDGLKDTIRDDKSQILWQVEGDQVMTGGGFDNNKVGEVHKAALKFVAKSSVDIHFADSALSELVVKGALEVRDELEAQGLRRGSLKPVGIGLVRFEQENDGMMGFPVCMKSKAPLTDELATRLLIESGIDTRSFVGTTVTDKHVGSEVPYRVVDAVGYVLDHSILRSTDLTSIVLLLARIQKHGWKREGNGFVAKPGKTRAVYPNACIPGAIEAMIASPFLDAVQNARINFLPSLQTKVIRNDMVWQALTKAIGQDYDYLAADWSQYDATVQGAILATVLQLVVKPFYAAQYYAWVDAMTYILTYKYLLCDTALCGVNGEELNQAKLAAKWMEVDRYTVFGLTGGLISGAKMTHVGGSLYGEVVIHRCIPRLCKHEPLFGAQAGDDTLLGWPRSSIDTSSVEATYTPIAEAAKLYGLDINPGKQIWHQLKGEVVKVFLQEVYQHNCDVRGIGSAFRPFDALPYSEHDKGLSVAEQEIATISRMNQGWDNPFIGTVVDAWFDHDQYLGVLFKTHGIGAFQLLVESTGLTLDTLKQRISVGSFNFGIDEADFISGRIPVLKVMADIAGKKSFAVSEQQALSVIYPEANKAPSAMTTPDVTLGDDQDVLGD